MNTTTDVNNKTLMFVVSWIFLIFALTLIAKTKLGYVIIYYALLLMILFLVVTEYQTLAPIFGSVNTPLGLDQTIATAQTQNTQTPTQTHQINTNHTLIPHRQGR